MDLPFGFSFYYLASVRLSWVMPVQSDGACQKSRVQIYGDQVAFFVLPIQKAAQFLSKADPIPIQTMMPNDPLCHNATSSSFGRNDDSHVLRKGGSRRSVRVVVNTNKKYFESC